MDNEKREKSPSKSNHPTASTSSDASKDHAPSSSGANAIEDGKNRGWPKGKKRYPKIPGAPKQPLSGYVHFLNFRRENLRKECPEISFAEISKKLATEWSQLIPEEKLKYMEVAEQDKERYNKEFADYQKTEAYKKYMQSLGKEKEPVAKKKPKKTDKAKQEATDASGEFKEDTGVDFPIFTEEFLEYNKARESELRQLRKKVTEMEEQNAVLQKHVENMQSAIGKLEAETEQQQENTGALEKHLEALKKMVITGLQGVGLPGRSEPVTMENVDEFMKSLNEAVDKQPESELVAKVREIVGRMDYKMLVN